MRPSPAETNAPPVLEDDPAALTDILLSSLEALAATGQREREGRNGASEDGYDHDGEEDRGLDCGRREHLVPHRRRDAQANAHDQRDEEGRAELGCQIDAEDGEGLRGFPNSLVEDEPRWEGLRAAEEEELVADRPCFSAGAGRVLPPRHECAEHCDRQRRRHHESSKAQQ